MRSMPSFEYPQDKKKALQRAKAFEVGTILYYIITIILMYLVMGRSAAMKAAWLDDLFALAPPIGFLISSQFRLKPPNKTYPYGHHRIVSLSFLFSSFALLSLGFYIFITSLIPLLNSEHATIASTSIYGHTIWLGWLMLVVLIFVSGLPAIFLGKYKIKIGEQLQDNVLYTDGRMNKAAWKTSFAAAIGVIGIGFGLWWADYIAAIIISLDILHDGFKNMSQVSKILMDHIPTEIGSNKAHPLNDRVDKYLKKIDWIDKYEVRLRQNGHVFFGEAFITLRRSVRDKPQPPSFILGKLAHIEKDISQLDWRIQDFSVTPMDSLEQ